MKKTLVLFSLVVICLSMAFGNALAQSWTKDANNPVLNLGPAGSWDQTQVHIPSVILDGQTYKMWYVGLDGSKFRIGYAASSDGVNWTKNTNNPVLDVGPSGSWDSESLHCPTVMYDGQTYKMWYVGFDSAGGRRIGYATSTDGVNWTKYSNNPVLDIGGGGAWDSSSVTQPTVLKKGNTYEMWYQGSDYYNWRVGYATSTNGTSWTKDSGNPVLNISPYTWDETGVADPSVIKVNAIYKMWYAGFDSYGVGRIGLATYK